MDKLNDFTLFVRAAQTLSFSETARQLGMSPSAVSKAIQRLEERLGVRLLNRTTRSLSLTEDGSAFFDRARQILDEIEEAEADISQSKIIPRGRLRLDLSVALGKMHILPALPQFMAQYPEITLDVSLSDRNIDLIEEGIDATVRVGTGIDNRLILHPVSMAKFITCAAPAYLKQHGTPKTPADLLNHQCVNFIYPQTRRHYEWGFQDKGETLQLAVLGTLRVDNAEAMLDAAINGVGIIQALNYVVGSAIANGKLKPILTEYTTTVELPIAVVYPQKKHLSAKVRAFIEFMRALIAQLRQRHIVD